MQNSPAGNGLANWLVNPPGVLVAQWESVQMAQLVADVFGYHAVQLGMPVLPGLAENRMPSRWQVLGPTEFGLGAEALRCDFTALPFDESSIDLAVLPHTLEWCGEATACLREVERVLRPEGRLVVTGFNPNSLWALRQHTGRALRLLKRHGAAQTPLFLPDGGEFVGLKRLRDWLRVLNFEVETVRFGLHGGAGFGRLGAKLWPNWGAVYLLSAVKRVPGPLLMRNARRVPRFAADAVPAIRRTGADNSFKNNSIEVNKYSDTVAKTH